MYRIQTFLDFYILFLFTRPLKRLFIAAVDSLGLSGDSSYFRGRKTLGGILLMRRFIKSLSEKHGILNL